MSDIPPFFIARVHPMDARRALEAAEKVLEAAGSPHADVIAQILESMISPAEGGLVGKRPHVQVPQIGAVLPAPEPEPRLVEPVQIALRYPDPSIPPGLVQAQLRLTAARINAFREQWAEKMLVDPEGRGVRIDTYDNVHVAHLDPDVPWGHMHVVEHPGEIGPTTDGE